ncbi:MAG: hypothetical protein PHU03_05805, partial [Syntrophales bacterium]|nr:hypothetical protein [Syntrophales bacterium]
VSKRLPSRRRVADRSFAMFFDERRRGIKTCQRNEGADPPRAHHFSPKRRKMGSIGHLSIFCEGCDNAV